MGQTQAMGQARVRFCYLRTRLLIFHKCISQLWLFVVGVFLIESQLCQAPTPTHTRSPTHIHTHTHTHGQLAFPAVRASDCRWQVLYSIKKSSKKNKKREKRENKERSETKRVDGKRKSNSNSPTATTIANNNNGNNNIGNRYKNCLNKRHMLLVRGVQWRAHVGGHIDGPTRTAVASIWNRLMPHSLHITPAGRQSVNHMHSSRRSPESQPMSNNGDVVVRAKRRAAAAAAKASKKNRTF